MTEQEHDNVQEPLTDDELEAENGEPLPDREAMTIIDPSHWIQPPLEAPAPE
jgi:hypothetical protein